jgi:hypothetical protein
VTPKPPIWIYECSSGPLENEGRYQTILLEDFWGALTPRIRKHKKWMQGAPSDVWFHLPESKIPSGTMDADAGIIARSGLRGRSAQMLAQGFPKYARSLLNGYPEDRVGVYLGSLLCDSMVRVLIEQNTEAWLKRAWACVEPYTRLAEDTGRLDLAIDASSAMDRKGHIGLLFLESLEQRMAEYGCKVYVEGVPVPTAGRGRMLSRNWIAQEPNWTRAVTVNPAAGIDADLLTGEGIRWASGHMWNDPKNPSNPNNAFGDDPMTYLRDVVRRGHRLACDERALVGLFRSSNWTEFQANLKGGG